MSIPLTDAFIFVGIEKAERAQHIRGVDPQSLVQLGSVIAPFPTQIKLDPRMAGFKRRGWIGGTDLQ